MLPLAITMGCPAGIGPEIILKYFSKIHNKFSAPIIVAGDIAVLDFYINALQIDCSLIPWQVGDYAPIEQGIIPVFKTSQLSPTDIHPGIFSKKTSIAMASAISMSVQGIQNGYFSGICTCPISKESLNKSGCHYPGHTEMLADLTRCSGQVMMLAGTSLRVTLASIHCSIDQVPALLNIKSLYSLYQTTYSALVKDFNIPSPKIAVAALNPHAGEGGMFGTEEQEIIFPSILKAQKQGMDIHGPFPPDTIFVNAAQGKYDAVVCMCHDQGLIPFKLLHFKDGVNITLGLPIVRTSVDHGTAYDIAGKGTADPASLTAAIELCHTIIQNRTTTQTNNAKG